MQIVKIYQFTLCEGADEAQLMDISAKLNEHLLNMEGFLYRSLSKAEDESWLDIVYWDSSSCAEKASTLMQHEDFADMDKIINVANLKATPSSIHSSVWQGMDEPTPA